MYKLNSVIGIDVAKRNVLITLQDGRCALVDLKKRTFVVEILLDSFYKWLEFYDVEKKYEKEILDILNNPNGYFIGPQAKQYIEQKETRDFYNKLKKEASYNY